MNETEHLFCAEVAKNVRGWECVGLEPTRDGWFTMRIRIHWWHRERGGPESNLRLGIRRERFARGDQFHRLCRLAPDLVEEIFQWWQQVQLLTGFVEAIARNEKGTREAAGAVQREAIEHDNARQRAESLSAQGTLRHVP